VLLYADTITESMRRMIHVTSQRRLKQFEYNESHGITPRSIEKGISETMQSEGESRRIEARVVRESGADYDIFTAISELKQEMMDAAAAMEFERAAMLRDEIRELEGATASKPRKQRTASKGKAH